MSDSEYIQYLYNIKTHILQKELQKQLGEDGIELFIDYSDGYKNICIDESKLESDITEQQMAKIREKIKKQFKVNLKIAKRETSNACHQKLDISSKSPSELKEIDGLVQEVRRKIKKHSIYFNCNTTAFNDASLYDQDLSVKTLTQVKKSLDKERKEYLSSMSWLEYFKTVIFNPLKSKLLEILVNKSAANARLEDYIFLVKNRDLYYQNQKNYSLTEKTINVEISTQKRITYSFYSNDSSKKDIPTVILLTGVGQKSQFNRDIQNFLNKGYNVAIFDNPIIGHNAYSNSYDANNLSAHPEKIRNIIRELQGPSGGYSNISVVATCFSGFLATNAVLKHNESNPTKKVKLILDRTFSRYPDVIRYGGISNSWGYSVLFKPLYPLRFLLAKLTNYMLKSYNAPVFIADIEESRLSAQKDYILANTNERCGVLGPVNDVNNEQLYQRIGIKFSRTDIDHSKSKADPHLVTMNQLFVTQDSINKAEDHSKVFTDVADDFIKASI